MIIGIGCDVVDHSVTKELGWSSDLGRLKRLFSQKELELFKVTNTVRFISGRFAAKEAVLKCIGTGMKDGISLTDIQILQNEDGKPIVKIGGEVEKIANLLGVVSFHISLSHTDNTSVAFVVAES